MTGMRRRVLVVDRRSELAESLRAALVGDDRPEIVHLRRTTQVLDVLAEGGHWDALVAGPSEESGAGLRRLAAIRKADPDLGLLVTINGKDPADLGALVKARPDELVRVPATTTALRNAVLAAVDVSQSRRAAATGVPVRQVETQTRVGAVYTVGGPSGGCGKTTVAVNLAAMLGRLGKHRVVLVDLDVQFGEVTAALQLRPVHTIHDVMFDSKGHRASGAEITEALASTLIETPYGFSVLPAPPDPLQGDAITADDVAHVLAVLRDQADYVVVDTPTGLQEVALAALDHSDEIVVVSQVDVPGVANLRTFLAMLQRLDVDPDHQHVLLNKEVLDSGVTAADAIEVLGPVAGTMPFDPGVLRALNEGRPFCVVEPHHPVSRRLCQALAGILPPDDAAAFVAGDDTPRKRRWWQKRSAA